MANRFNAFEAEGEHNPTDGTIDFNGKTITAVNLGFSLNVTTDPTGRLQTTAFPPVPPGGADTEIQYNSGGVLAGDPLFIFNEVSKLMTINGLSTDIFGNLLKDGSTLLHNLGTANLGFGISALSQVTSGLQNLAGGFLALGSLTTGDFNTAYGALALLNCVDGLRNTAFGSTCLESLVGTDDNAAFGNSALHECVGNRNMGFGHQAGSNITTANDTISVGNLGGVPTTSGVMRYGTVGTHTSCFMAGIHGVTPVLSNVTEIVVVDSTGELGSSIRGAYDTGFMSGNTLIWIDAAEVEVSTGHCRDDNDLLNLINPGPLVAMLTTTGPGGIQTGSSEASDTWYGVYIIGDSSGSNQVNCLLIPNGTAFSQSGYDVKRRVGWIRNNSSSDVLKFSSQGKASYRKIMYDESKSGDLQVLAAGTASSFTDLDLSPGVAPSSLRCILFLRYNSSTSSADLELRPNGSTVTNALYGLQNGIATTSHAWTQLEMECDSAQLIEYQVTNGDVFISVQGFVDEI